MYWSRSLTDRWTPVLPGIGMIKLYTALINKIVKTRNSTELLRGKIDVLLDHSEKVKI